VEEFAGIHDMFSISTTAGQIELLKMPTALKSIINIL
jgi:hypothetical protein